MPAVLCARAADRSAPRTSGEKGRKKFVDCEYDVKNDRVGLWWVRVFAAQVNDYPSLPFRRRRLTKYSR
jgi:hypothetical protein